MGKLGLKAEIKSAIYKKEGEIPNELALLKTIITYKEVFYSIFLSAGNPMIEMQAYNPKTKEKITFEINTRYERHTTPCIKREYWKLLGRNKFLKDINNILEVAMITNVARHKRQIIYSNSSTTLE